MVLPGPASTPVPSAETNSGRPLPKLYELAWVTPIVLVAVLFAFRTGVPAFRHDWIWPSQPHDFVRWFVDSALSEWNPTGLGNGGQIPTFNLVLGPLALLGACGFPSHAILFLLVATLFCGAYAGLLRSLAAFDITVDTVTARALSLIYAFGPIAFQKTVAGHIFWLAAYAALPWLAAEARSWCRRDSYVVRHVAAASVLYALATTQIQFVVFDALAIVVILAIFARNHRAWVAGGVVIAIGLFHNVNALLAPFRSSDGFFLARVHGTLDWERDMSGSLFDLAHFGGYVGYDTASLSAPIGLCLVAGKWVLFGAAIAGIACDRGRRALVFGTLSFGALAFASGWNGPLQKPLEWALLNMPLFTVFRELYHVMALYAYATVMLAALAFASLGKWARYAAVPLAAAMVIPFVSLELDRTVPTIVEASSDHVTTQHLRALLPYQEPISMPGLASGGSDPARFVASDAMSGEPPLVLRSIIDGSLPPARANDALEDLGIQTVAWRHDRISQLPRTFEPHVGATFEAFERRQIRLARRYGDALVLSRARSPITVEDVGYVGRVETLLADGVTPPGREVEIASSYFGNDIRRQWVSGRMWSWFAPDDLAILADPVFTASRAPMPLSLGARFGDTVYVLASSTSMSLDGQIGTRVNDATPRPYAWYRWSMRGDRPIGYLSGRGFTSVVRCIVSRNARWTHRPASLTSSRRPRPLDYEQHVPWSLVATLPPNARVERIVYGRSFSGAWHLDVAGVDFGASHRVDGILNGWTIPPGTSVRRATLSYEPQRRSGFLVAADVLVLVTLLVITFGPNRRRVP